MDEPFSALDPISREKLQDDLIELQTKICPPDNSSGFLFLYFSGSNPTISSNSSTLLSISFSKI
jgi:ABC-type thiamine transport system ATPase subunit